jgi:hypothetical protein
VHADGLEKLPDGRMAWKDVTGASGICGIPPVDDPCVVDARRKYNGISNRQVQFLYRALPNEPPYGSKRFGSRYIAGRRYSTTSRGIRRYKSKRRVTGLGMAPWLTQGENVSASGIGQRDAVSYEFPSIHSAFSPVTGGLQTMGGTTKVVGTFALPLPLHVNAQF